MIATKLVTSNIPKLLIANVPPVYSSVLSVPESDRLARSFTSCETSFRDLSPQFNIAGTINPSSPAIAIAMLYYNILAILPTLYF